MQKLNSFLHIYQEGKMHVETDYLQIKPVKTNKARLGFISANKKTKLNEENTDETTSGECTPLVRVRKAYKEQKSPKICEICGNTYKYQHALDR